MASDGSPSLEGWEEEVLARHSWGQHGEAAASDERARLRKLWDAIGPLDKNASATVEQIGALEICNWKPEESILGLCGAIGQGKPAEMAIGHLKSVSDDRWREVWGYYLSLREWLPGQGPSGCLAFLAVVDPDGKIQTHVHEMLGERDELKETCVERLCLCLERWLGGFAAPQSAEAKTHEAAVARIEQEAGSRDAEGQVLNAVSSDGDGRLEPCGHKAFRRYDIIISSIGAGQWRGAMPIHGTDGSERAETLERYISPIQSWIDGRKPQSEIAGGIHASLGDRDPTKRFLASPLVSLLRAQQIAARNRARSRAEKPAK